MISFCNINNHFFFHFVAQNFCVASSVFEFIFYFIFNMKIVVKSKDMQVHAFIEIEKYLNVVVVV